MNNSLSKNTDKFYSTFHENEEQNNSKADTKEKKMEETSKSKHASSEMNAFFNVLKCNFGLGILATPYAFYNSGLWFGLAVAPALGTICIYCMYILVTSSRELRQRLNCGPMNIQDTVEAAFVNGPKKLRKFAKTMRIITQVSVMLLHLGTCCVYYVFVSQNIIQILSDHFDIRISKLVCNAYLIIFFTLTGSIRYLKFISLISMVATVSYSTSLAVILYYCTRDLNDPTTLPAIGKPWDIALFYGGIMFNFEGIGSVLLVEGDMKDSSNFIRLNGTLITSQVVIVLTSMAIGFFGYLQYGANVKSAITLNLPPEDILAQCVTIFLTISIYFSFPVIFHVAVDSMKSILLSDEESEKRKLIKEYTFRISMVLFMFTLSTAVPFLGLLISFIGSLVGTYIAILTPVIANVMTFWPEEGIPKLLLFKSLTILSIGMIGLVFGVTTSVLSISDALKKTTTDVKLYA